MDEVKIREPIQKRSIEKKEKIIKVGFDLICEKGYFNISTPDIAKAAGVSTGIVYNYFQDKRDIFIEGIKKYSNSILFPMLEILQMDKIKKTEMKNILDKMIQIFIEKHTISKSAHEEMIAMSHLDTQIDEIFKNSELEMTNKVAEILRENGFTTSFLEEKVHISMGLIENLCHEIVYHNHPNLNQDVMKEQVIEIVEKLLKE